jgi:hypothetical protein
MNRSTTVISILSLCVLLPATAGAQTMKLGEVLIFHTPDFKPDADPVAFENRVGNEIVASRKTSGPASELHLLRADRGSRKGQYVLVSAMSLQQRGKEPASSPLKMTSFTGGDGQRAEYHLLSPEAVGSLPDVEILGVHYTKVRPERREAFERFVGEKVHPAVGNLRPDLRILYYRAASGGSGSNYIAVIALTRASRDKYWPGGSDSDDLRAAFRPVQGLTTDLRTYLVEGSYLADPKFAAAVYESREWTDFVLVPAKAR